jgi:hypothetical protein
MFSQQILSYRGTQSTSFSFSYAEYKDVRNGIITLYVPILQADKKVISLDAERQNFENNSISWRINGKIRRGEAEGTLTLSLQTGSSGTNPYVVDNVTYRTKTANTSTNAEIMKDLPDVSTSYSNRVALGNNVDTILNTSASVKYLQNIEYMLNTNVEKTVDYFKINIYIVTGVQAVTLNGAEYKKATVQEQYPNLSGSHTITGMYAEYEPISMDVSLNGRVIEYKIDVQNKVVKDVYGRRAGIISFEENEFMQEDNYYENAYGEETPAIQNFFGKTISSYINGKETATIRCSIADYYDYDTGEKVISKDNSTGRMSFDLYDEVIPTVLGANGQENPLSTYKNGDPKVFKVLGTRKFFNGAVWQELSLQEI